ncbi:lactonase family protein [Oceanobacillus kimchii]|uniref:lactonase family protein n=1 Tax=Oceanobacillus kimchii TaxID=746691 RepID=UPI00034B44A4|nr:lactonase family protein [Oceanobacillus kimchii]
MTDGKTFIGFAGTYTRKTSEGIYRFTLNTDTKQFEQVEVAEKVDNPTYLTISEDKKYLYSVAQEESMGGVKSFQINPEKSELSLINGQLVEGAPPCHLDVRGEVLVTGNYHKGDIGVHLLNNAQLEQGKFLKHEGNGPHKRQEKPHVHYTGFTPDGSYVVVADLGTDELVTYRIEGDSLSHVSTLNVAPGSGPRHIVFHPDKPVAYLLTELSSEVIVLDYNKKTGQFKQKQTIKAIPESFKDTNDASAIHISSDGKFIYTGNRGHNSIAVFSVDDSSGTLTLVEITPSGGEWPRDFVLDPTEQFLIASNQHSGNIVLFQRNTATGKLSLTNSEIEVPEVVCVKFL